MIRPFDLRRPTALGEVGDLLAEHGDDASLYAGGTELLLLMKEGFVRPRVLIDLKRVAGLAGVRAADDGVQIGATTPHRAVERGEIVRRDLPLVAGVARHVANVRVRSVGTVGGNLAFADPHSDLATLFLVFDARVELWGPAGTRAVPLADFVRGPYETARRADEILTGIHLRRWPASARGAYVKFGVHERPTLGVAAMVRLDAERARVVEARVALGCIGPRPERLSSVEAGLRSVPVADAPAAVADLAQAAAARLDAIEDLHGAADYKREMARVYLRRTLGAAVARAQGRPADVRHPHTVGVVA